MGEDDVLYIGQLVAIEGEKDRLKGVSLPLLFVGRWIEDASRRRLDLGYLGCRIRLWLLARLLSPVLELDRASSGTALLLPSRSVVVSTHESAI